MSLTQFAQNEEPFVVGDESLDPDALVAIEKAIQRQERIIAWSGFDWETKVFAVTDKGIMVADNEGK